MFEDEFLTLSSGETYRQDMAKAVEAILEELPGPSYSGKSPADLAALFAADPPQTGSSMPQVLQRARQVAAHSIRLTHPHTVAHLHCPPLRSGLIAEAIVAALNPSMDSFDQAPAATMLELEMCRWLCRELEFPAGSDAVFTSGGTQSNFMGLCLSRDAAITAHWKWPVQQKGLPPVAARLRFLCSEVAHFSVEKAAHQLGLGSDAVIKVAVDESCRMSPAALAEQLQRLRREDLVPAAIVATAGTTDFGSIDPLPEIAALAHMAGAWLHVDAAYGSGLLLSHRHRALLRGIEHADSVSMDFHKWFWQPISCAAFALRDASQFRHLAVHADYLNPESDDVDGVPNLVNKSLATTRRFDALKLWLSLQLLGREKFAQMIDRTIELAAFAAERIRQNPRLELLHTPQTGCVVFRYISARAGADCDTLNKAIRQTLFERGLGVIGHTRARGQQCLKFTCLNPTTSEKDLDDLLQLIVTQGQALEE